MTMETGLCEPWMGSVAPVARSQAQRIEAMQTAAREIAARRPWPRRERLSGIHNPWGHASVLTDAWCFLDLCEDSEIMDGVEALIGKDIVLWDTELHLDPGEYRRFVEAGREGRYWPVMPRVGVVVLIAPEASQPVTCVALEAIAADLPALHAAGPLFVIRYMPGSSSFVRDGRALANWVAMEEQPLVNYAARPLWMVRGEDRAGNDFVTGFSPTVPRWAGIQPEEH